MDSYRLGGHPSRRLRLCPPGAGAGSGAGRRDCRSGRPHRRALSAHPGHGGFHHRRFRALQLPDQRELPAPLSHVDGHQAARRAARPGSKPALCHCAGKRGEAAPSGDRYCYLRNHYYHDFRLAPLPLPQPRGEAAMTAYEALHNGAAWCELEGRGKIRMAGEDRARLLHALCTNHIQELKPGEGCYAFFLNAQGRILADANIFCREDDFLLDTEPETAAKLLAHIDHYIIADDVTLEDLTGSLTTIAVEGPRAPETLQAIGAPALDGGYTNAVWGACTVAHASSTGQPGAFLFAPPAERDRLVRSLESAGAIAATSADLRVVRIENGRARY